MSPDSSSPSLEPTAVAITNIAQPSPTPSQQQTPQSQSPLPVANHTNNIQVQVQECTQSQEVKVHHEVILVKATSINNSSVSVINTNSNTKLFNNQVNNQNNNQKVQAHYNGNNSGNNSANKMYIMANNSGSVFSSNSNSNQQQQNSYSVVDTTTNNVPDGSSMSHDLAPPKMPPINQPIYHHQQPQKQHQVATNLTSLKDDVELNIGITF
jgi:hypothetical protein